MLTPEDRAELEQIRAAREREREISRWETRVARRAVDRGALYREIGEVLGVSEPMVHKILNRRFRDNEDEDSVP